MKEAILAVSADVPWPPDGGGRIASLRVLEAITKHYDVDLIALRDPSVDTDMGELRDRFRSVELLDQPFTFGRHRIRQLRTMMQSLYGLDPYRIVKFRNRELHHAIRRKLGGQTYAAVHYEQFGVAPYRVPALPSTLSHQNVETNLYKLGITSANSTPRKLWSLLEATKLARVEPRLVGSFDWVLVLSTHDRDLLVRQGMQRVSVVPIPVQPSDAVPAPSPHPTVLTLGTLSWFGVEDGLLWFRELVWPRIRAELPAATWMIVGANPSRRISRLDGIDGIAVRGYVDDLQPVLSASRLLVVPLFVGGGVRIKLLETMAAGRPFVATSVGALGLSISEGAGGYIHDEPSAFASSAIRLLQDDDAWVSVGRQGQRFVKEHHSAAATSVVVMEAIEQARIHHGRTAL